MKLHRINWARPFRWGEALDEPKLPSFQRLAGTLAPPDKFDCRYQRGVALVITLILLSVITFLAITFLALSRRERGATTTATEQTTARFAADTALERVKAELLAGMLSTSNAHNFGPLVSTNFINAAGFQTGITDVTNVNYAYPNGTVLNANDASLNLANLLYDSRVPVFVTNRLFANSNEFRFYRDENRNGRYDTNGFLPVISSDPANPFYHTNGNVIATPIDGATVSNYFVGDPEWRGVLPRPDEPHAADNLFIARYAFIVVPEGKTLDANYLHNYAKLFSPQMLPTTGDGFIRNQGVGPWELNFASFLVDLNTNYWNPPANSYAYTTNRGLPNRGAAFDDALALLRYRYSYTNSVSANWLRSVQNIYPAPGNGVPAFSGDFIDGYSDGPLLVDYRGLTADDDSTRVRFSWSGDDNPTHFFTTQELFDRTKTSINNTNGYSFADRLRDAGVTNSSYDRYTYYRLLSQLGTDSAPEPRGKVNLNYINLPPFASTNFIPWDNPVVATQFGHPGSEVFFTNAVDKLLRAAGYNFGVHDIPVFVVANGGFVYQPSVNRLLQVAANIFDNMTPRVYGTATNLPTVFRPQFGVRGTDVYITNFVEVNQLSELQSLRVRNLSDTNVAANIQRDDLIFGVPLIVGAKKGLPNFNEFAMQSYFQITRKLQVTRPTLASPQSTWKTNMEYVIGVSNLFGVEAWNSYRTTFARPIEVYVTNYLTMTLTNNYGINMTSNAILGRFLPMPNWAGYNANLSSSPSFLVPMKTNFVFLSDSAFVPTPPHFTTDWINAWDKSQTFPIPQWGLGITNHLQFIIVDQATRRVIDYVQLDGLNTLTNLSEVIREPNDALGFEGQWSTNKLPSGLPQGIYNQIDVSLGQSGGTTTEWTDYGGPGQASGNTKKYEIDYFRAFYGFTPYNQWPGGTLINTSLVQQVPFTPTKRVSQYLTWQANDPLVHYVSGELKYLDLGDGIEVSLSAGANPIKNIGKLNERYRPWGGNVNLPTDPDKHNLALKDPAVRSSDDWQFPTNKFPNVGWLGRIHRGTPWQTVYLKSPGIETNSWQLWTGNPNPFDALLTHPTNDWRIFDVFTAAINDNASHGQLSVNQSGLAAWSAAFGGMVALTNSALGKFDPWIIDPVGTAGTNSALWKIWDGINRERSRVDVNTNFVHPNQTFQHLGEILAVPELSVGSPAYVGTYPNGYWINASPFLNLGNPNLVDKTSKATAEQQGLNDAVYEWLPQQVMGLLRVDEPRFVVYSYGQTLKPADHSILTSGPFQGMCTNYQVTAEVATRALLRVEGSPDPTQATNTVAAKRYPPRIVIENFNLLPPD